MRNSKEMLFVFVCQMHRKHICMQESMINGRSELLCIYSFALYKKGCHIKRDFKNIIVFRSSLTILFHPNLNITWRRINKGVKL